MLAAILFLSVQSDVDFTTRESQPDRIGGDCIECTEQDAARRLHDSRTKQASSACALNRTIQRVPTMLAARVSELKRGNFDRFGIDLPVPLAARAGLKPN
jgi:hypothetical protein